MGQELANLYNIVHIHPAHTPIQQSRAITSLNTGYIPIASIAKMISVSFLARLRSSHLRLCAILNGHSSIG